MGRESTVVEKRAIQRHRPKGSSSLVLLPDNIVSYSILDISEQGIAFSYEMSGPVNRMHEKGTIDFFGATFGLSDIAVRIVSDCPIHLPGQDDGPSLSRCSLEFIDPSDEQKQVLKSFVGGKIS